MTHWTASKVAERLEEAAQTLRRLPPVKVNGYFGVWPQIIHDIYDKQDWEKQIIHRGPPSAHEISRMERTIMWFRFLALEENRLIWLRANKISWKNICWRMGCDRSTAWRQWVFSLTAIAYALNANVGNAKVNATSNGLK